MSVTLDQYQQDAMRVCAPLTVARESLASDSLLHVMHAALGLTSDLDELLHNTDATNAVAEAGDCFWFLCRGYTALSIDMQASVIDAPDRYLSPAALTAFGSNPEGQAVSLVRAAQHEAATLCDVIKAAIFYGKTKFKVPNDQGAEITDATLETAAAIRLNHIAAWLALYCRMVLHKPPRDVMAANTAKLKARYGEKFSQTAALTRNEDAEHAAVAETAGLH